MYASLVQDKCLAVVMSGSFSKLKLACLCVNVCLAVVMSGSFFKLKLYMSMCECMFLPSEAEQSGSQSAASSKSGKKKKKKRKTGSATDEEVEAEGRKSGVNTHNICCAHPQVGE